MMKKKVCIINTGGTIGMDQSGSGLRPRQGFLTGQLQTMPELKAKEMPDLEIVEYEPLLDSSNMSPEDWLKIANDIAKRYEQFDGFVVLHGTDTMAYTASALSFMLLGLAKPVILTGSQIPLGQIRNDARENLVTAIILAADYGIPEVCILFGSQLLRGCRSTKASATRFVAFDSPNYGAFGLDWNSDSNPPGTRPKTGNKFLTGTITCGSCFQTGDFDVPIVPRALRRCIAKCVATATESFDS